MPANDIAKRLEAMRKERDKEIAIRIARLKSLPPPKFERGDKVCFSFDDGEDVGVVSIVDFGGSFEHDNHSYDILTKDGLCKHVPEEYCRLVGRKDANDLLKE